MHFVSHSTAMLENSRKQEKSVLLFRAMGGWKLDRKTYRRGYEGIFPCNIVNCFSHHNYHYVVAGVPCVLCMVSNSWETDIYNSCIKVKLYEQNSTVEQRFLFCFSWVGLDENQQRDGFTCQRLLREGQGLWEVCRRKDNKSLTVVLYFFLLQDALAAHLCW